MLLYIYDSIKNLLYKMIGYKKDSLEKKNVKKNQNDFEKNINEKKSDDLNERQSNNSNELFESGENATEGELLGKKRENNITYNLDDIELKKINLDKNICIRLLSNVHGTFVDVRKYYKGYPTKKGIRFSLFMFKKIIEIMKDDILKEN